MSIKKEQTPVLEYLDLDKNQDKTPIPTAELLAQLGSTPQPYVHETFGERCIRKTKENPFVPLGAIFTTIVLGMMGFSIRDRNHKKSQLLMRLRVGGQAFTIAAICIGTYVHQRGSKADGK